MVMEALKSDPEALGSCRSFGGWVQARSVYWGLLFDGSIAGFTGWTLKLLHIQHCWQNHVHEGAGTLTVR